MKPFILSTYSNNEPKACEFDVDSDSSNEHHGSTAAVFELKFEGDKDSSFACPKCVFGHTPKIVCVKCQTVIGHKIFTDIKEDPDDVNGICEDCMAEAKEEAEDCFEEEQERLDEDRRAKKLKIMEKVW